LNHNDYLKPKDATPDALPVDPLVRAKAKKDESQLKREHAELVERVRDAEARHAILKDLEKIHVPKIQKREKSRKASARHEATAHLMLSDVHAGERVTYETTSGRNEYNLAICENSMGRFFGAGRWLTDMHREGFLIRDTILWLGGDIISGMLHDDQHETDEIHPVETIAWMKPRLVRGIDSLLDDPKLERLIVPCSYGNHGRTTLKPRGSSTAGKKSLEWLLYADLKREYEQRGEKRIEFVIDQSAHQFVDVYGWTNHYHHGDRVRYQGGVGGLSIPLNKRVPKWENVRPARYHHIGHYHTFLDLGHTLVNGSIKGYDAFAYDEGFSFEQPQQAFCLYEEQHGKCCVSPIWVRGGEWNHSFKGAA